MCELFCLSSRYPTRVTLSLEHFARRGGYDTGSVDGWGVAFFDRRDARVYKEPEPAANSAWVRFIEDHQGPTGLCISHVRHATRGALSHANTQPFVRELGGRMHVFAHNGQLDDIDSRCAGAWQRFQPIGETDSEIAFCILLERLAAAWAIAGAVPSLRDRLRVFHGFAADMRALGPANFLYSDGDVLFAHSDRRKQANGRVAPPGLWRSQRRCRVDPDAPPPPQSGGEPQDQAVTLVASVPLDAGPWSPVASGEVVVVAGGRSW